MQTWVLPVASNRLPHAPCRLLFRQRVPAWAAWRNCCLLRGASAFGGLTRQVCIPQLGDQTVCHQLQVARIQGLQGALLPLKYRFTCSLSPHTFTHFRSGGGQETKLLCQHLAQHASPALSGDIPGKQEQTGSRENINTQRDMFNGRIPMGEFKRQ